MPSANLLEHRTDKTGGALSKPFQFDRQGQWVCVFYDNAFYVGQVFEITGDGVAVGKFLQNKTGRFDFFSQWPATVDIPKVDAQFVFAWDFDVDIVSSDGRVWSVPSVKDLCKQ